MKTRQRRTLDSIYETMRHALLLDGMPNQCTAVSLLAAPIVRIAFPDTDWNVALGRYKEQIHCWLQDSDGAIIDLTWGQYDDAVCDWQYSSHSKNYVANKVFTREEENKFRDQMFVEREGSDWLTVKTGIKDEVPEWRS